MEIEESAAGQAGSTRTGSSPSPQRRTPGSTPALFDLRPQPGVVASFGECAAKKGNARGEVVIVVDVVCLPAEIQQVDGITRTITCSVVHL
jgi:hypothetical protein